VSGRVQQFHINGQPHDTLKVPPFGIVKGEQWRMYSEPSKSYPIPLLIERKRDKGGEFGVFLLEPEQIVEYFNPQRSPTKTLNPHYAPKHMQMFLDNGKPQEWDMVSGKPKRSKYEIADERPEVTNVLRRMMDELKSESVRRTAILEGRSQG
jgi:hypothetical protein